jgi:hypothetical protein
MKFINLRLSFLPMIFVFGIVTSLPVLAGQQDFVLTSPDNKELGHGRYEELPDAIAKIVVTMHNQDYSGTGVISKMMEKPAKGLRADRAMMVMKHKKRVLTELVANDGARLACELNMEYGDILGQCVNLDNQQVLRISSSKEKAK